MLQIHQSAYQALRQHSEAAYPHECCGILLGQSYDGARTVTNASPVPNASPTPRNHYQIAPQDLIRVQKTAHQSGEEILGFYHSHPNHPAQHSPTDFAEAHWLGCSYVITSVQNGQATETRSFLLAGSHEEEKSFLPEEVFPIQPLPIRQIPSALS